MDALLSITGLRYLLLAVLFAPLAFAAVAAALGRGHKVVRRVACWMAALHLVMTVALVVPVAFVLKDRANELGTPTAFQPIAVPGDLADGESNATTWNLFSLGKAVDGLPPPAVQFFVGLDGLNVWLVLLTSLMTYLAVLLSWTAAEKRAGGYYAWVFVLQTAVTGAFVSFDVILFYVFFELTLIPAFFLIGGWGAGGGRQDAARKFFLYTLLGGLFTLVGLVGLVLTNPTPRTPPAEGHAARVLGGPVVADGGVQYPVAGPVSFSVNRLMRNVSAWTETHRVRVERAEELAAKREAEATAKESAKSPDAAAFRRQADDAARAADEARGERDRYQAAQAWLFFALVAGFAVKTPIVPFHTWLPAAYTEAPAAVTMLLSAVLAKLGTLGLLRIVLPLCPDMAVRYGPSLFALLGAVGIVYAAFCAFAQTDAKRMAAYSSVSHLGLVVVGLFAGNAEGLGGAALHMVNHGLTAGAIFGLLAFLSDRFRTTDMGQYGGLWARYPKFTFFMVVICLAAVGLPGLNNFASEMLLVGSAFKPETVALGGYALGAAAAVGVFLSAWYTMTMLRRVFFGPLRLPLPPGDPAPPDVSSRELAAFALPAVLCLALGLFPQPVLDTMKADVGVVQAKVQAARDRLHPELKEPVPPPVVGPIRR